MPGVAFQLPWSPLWISVWCLWAPHPPLPSQSRLKHWFHVLWACNFPCLYLLHVIWPPKMCLLRGLLSPVSRTLKSFRFYSKNNLIFLKDLEKTQTVWHAKIDISGSNQRFPSCRRNMQRSYEIFSKLSFGCRDIEGIWAQPSEKREARISGGPEQAAGVGVGISEQRSCCLLFFFLFRETGVSKDCVQIR